MHDAYTLKWHDTIDGIDPADWDRIYGGQSVLKRHAFSRSVERSALEGVSYLYLEVRAGSQTVALASCFLFEIDLDILAPAPVRRAAAFVRRAFSRFLRLTLLFVGSPVATCENHIGVDLTKVQAGSLGELGDVIFNAIAAKAKERSSFFSIVKELPESESALFRQLFGSRFVFFPSLPTSRVPLLGAERPYPSMLRRRYRKRFRRAIASSEKAGHRWAFERNYGHFAPELHRLYIDVYERSDNKFEKLTEQFFRELACGMPDSSCVLTCRDASGALIAASLIFEDEHRLIPLYVSLDYSEDAGMTAYYNLIFRAILEAERKQKRCVVLGQTSYVPKAYSGAVFEPLGLGLHSNARFGQFLIRRVIGALFRDTALPESVHSEELVNDPLFRSACRFR